MTKPRSETAGKAFRQAWCDPRGDLTEVGKICLSDIAKFCRYADGPTRHDSTGRVDELATMEAVGMHKVYRRMCLMLLIDEMRAMRLALAPLQQPEE